MFNYQPARQSHSGGLPITNYFKRLDWVLNSAIIFLLVCGLLLLASTSTNFFWLQLLWGAMGFAIIILIANFDWRPFVVYPWFVWGIYIVALILLALTLTSPPIRGIHAWLNLGSFKIQTSELAKISLIFVYSYFFAKGHVGIGQYKNIFKSFLFFLVPVLLILIQPDMGTALILFGIWFGYLLISGIRWGHLLIAGIVFILVSAFMWTNVLENYQKDRIIGLFNPSYDPLGINYNVIQSKIAIGSAGFLGKGFGQGTQVQLGFLPEAQTDFALAAFIEEWGILGGILIIAAFLILFFRIIFIGMESENNFAKFICLGTMITLLLHFILNVGSNIGLIPVIGVPFPFFSYGGSSFLANALLIGLIQSIVKHRFK